MRRGEETLYRDFRIYALSHFPASFTSSAAEARARPLEWYADRIETDGDPRHFVISAFDGERLIGIVGLSGETRLSEQHKATQYGMAVHEDYAGRGIGKQLVRALITEARRIPALKQISLSLTRDNEAAELLYRSCGFEAYGLEPRATFVDGAYYDKLMMVLRLD